MAPPDALTGGVHIGQQGGVGKPSSRQQASALQGASVMSGEKGMPASRAFLCCQPARPYIFFVRITWRLSMACSFSSSCRRPLPAMAAVMRTAVRSLCFCLPSAVGHSIPSRSGRRWPAFPQSGDLGRNIHGYVQQIVVQVLIRLIQGTAGCLAMSPRMVSTFSALLPLHIVMGAAA